MRPASSYADGHHDGDGHSHDGGGHGHDGGWHGRDEGWHGHHDHSYIGVGFSMWPDDYYYSAPYYPPPDEVLVSPPVTVVQPPTVIEPEAPDSFTINIPNKQGGYTAVTLRRSGSGFIGPQGEFYTQFPTVYQLQTIYGK